MRDASLILSVSQLDIENKYYLIDIPDLIQSKQQMIGQERMNDLYMLIATNNRGLPDDEFSKYIEQIKKTIGTNENAENEFDRDKMEELRALTNMGANMT